MADYTVEIDSFPDHKRGDKWPGIASVGPVLINDAQPALALARVRMQFALGARRYVIDSEAGDDVDATFVIDDADTWEASVAEIQDFLPAAGDWSWDMEFYETGKSSPLTLYKGTLTVLADV